MQCTKLENELLPHHKDQEVAPRGVCTPGAGKWITGVREYNTYLYLLISSLNSNLFYNLVIVKYVYTIYKFDW